MDEQILPKKKSSTKQKRGARADDVGSVPPSDTLADRVRWFQAELVNCCDVAFQAVRLGADEGVLIYVCGLFDIKFVEERLLQPLQREAEADSGTGRLATRLFDGQLSVSVRFFVNTDCRELLHHLMDGHGILLFDIESRMMDLPFPSFEKRAIEEPSSEAVLRGPRESFVESVDTNLAMVRRRIRSSKLKMEQLVFGNTTNTRAILVYVQDHAEPDLVAEMKRRLSYLDMEAVLGSSYVEENIVDDPFSPFPQVQYTERPDTMAASLLEGRVALMTDNTPVALLAPATFFMIMQSAEDYYQPYIAASWIRWIRLSFLLISLLLPSFYIAVTTFHPEMIPFNLLITVSASREIVPFPALMEAFIMEIAFEALREASVRIPKSIGQTVSIIGALIIGTAAVQAGIVSAPMVIIVSVTGIASFIIPNFDLGLSFRLLRFPMMILAGVFGIFGIACGIILIYVHMISLHSFGSPYLAPLAPRDKQSLKDVFVRAPWWKMATKPFFTNHHHTDRSSTNMRGWKQGEEDES